MALQSDLQQLRDRVMATMPAASIEVFENSLEIIRTDQLKQHALQVGDEVPSMQLLRPDGSTTTLRDLLNRDYLVLNFYRGGWCPYCNLELRAYDQLGEAFGQLGAEVIGISAELPHLAAATSAQNQLSLNVFTDPDAALMKAMGLVFALDPASKAAYRGFGIDLREKHGSDKEELPVPATYVIDRQRRVVLRHFEEDYTTRLEPETLLQQLKALNHLQPTAS